MTSGEILVQILYVLAKSIQDGISTQYLDNLARGMIFKYKVKPAFLGYKPQNFGGEEGFPGHICVSINQELVHGIPKEDRIIHNGDVVKIDIGIVDENGQYYDGATTVLVGKCSSAARNVVEATQEALQAAVAVAKSGNTTLDIATAVEAVAKKYDVHVIEHYGGHGIGEKLHMEPAIPNRVSEVGTPITLVKGMRIAIEPMFATNSGKTYIADDGWTVKLFNKGVCAHFEQTVTIE
jgi:methionyl aminopeptidase